MLSSPTSKTSQVLLQLEGELTNGHYPPGSKLPAMRALTQRYGVSTMVLHQVSQILEAKGLVKCIPRQGIFVSAARPTPPMVIGIITTIRPENMERYYEGLFTSINACGGVSIPVLAGAKTDIRNMLMQKPSRVLVDLEGDISYSLEQLYKLLRNVPFTFFNRFEWIAPQPQSAVLLDYLDMTVQALEHFIARGHRRVVFLGHHPAPRAFKQQQLTQAGQLTGLPFDSPEFEYCAYGDFEQNPERIVRIFAQAPPSAIFSRSDNMLYNFMRKLSIYYPACKDMDRIGCYNTMWSRIPNQEFSTFDPNWENAWKQAINSPHHGISFFKPTLIVRDGQRSRRLAHANQKV